MKTATVKELKIELQNRSPEELVELCLRLSKFKKENKELLTYLLYEAKDEEGYIHSVKRDVDTQFAAINTRTYYFIKKGVRKILRTVKKYIRYSKKKETEVELLLYFCLRLKRMTPSMNGSQVLKNLYHRELASIEKKLGALHEDLQYDYQQEVDALCGK